MKRAIPSLAVRLLTRLHGVALLLLVAGCGSDIATSAAPPYAYGLADMQKVAVGDYTGTWTPSGKSAATLTLHLDYAQPGTKSVCGSRTLGGPATLCIDVSSMGVTGKITTSDGTYTNGVVSGSFDVYGTELTSGSLTLRFPDTSTLSVPFENGKLRAQNEVNGANSVVATVVLTKTM